MIKHLVTTALAAATILLSVVPSSAHTARCENGSEPQWYAFAAAYSSWDDANNAAGYLGETLVQHIGDTNSPNHHKDLWLVYRGWVNTRAEANADVAYFKANGHRDAYAKQLCMW